MNDLVNSKFGKWLVVSFLERKNYKNYLLCRCECGNERRVQESALLNGKSKSCGCLQKEVARVIGHNNASHNGSVKNQRLYRIWKQMRIRCNCKTNPTYKYYGARGITICEEWNDFSVFREWALSNGYADNLTIERKNVNGNYCAENCCWIPKNEQARNRRSSVYYEFQGVRKTQVEWAKELGIRPSTLIERIEKYGVEVALSKKKRG